MDQLQIIDGKDGKSFAKHDTTVSSTHKETTHSNREVTKEIVKVGDNDEQNNFFLTGVNV